MYFFLNKCTKKNSSNRSPIVTCILLKLRMTKIENFGIGDQTLDNFREFMQMVEGTEVDYNLLCPVCLDVLFRPHWLDPCLHIFCEPCLRRLSLARINTCPVCRAPIQKCIFNEGKYLCNSALFLNNCIILSLNQTHVFIIICFQSSMIQLRTKIWTPHLKD